MVEEREIFLAKSVREPGVSAEAGNLLAFVARARTSPTYLSFSPDGFTYQIRVSSSS